MCQRYTHDTPILAAALLHDVLEDTPVTEQQMSDFLIPVLGEEEACETVKFVVELTNVYTWAAYPQWNRQKRKHLECERMKDISPDAQTIKYADVIDNGLEITAQDPGFAGKYLREANELLKVIRAGNPVLYEEACSLINKLAKLKGR